jgi:hypothetical protein
MDEKPEKKPTGILTKTIESSLIRKMQLRLKNVVYGCSGP